MKIVFFGTPDYVISILEALYKTYNNGPEKQLIAVVTQAPQKVGREQKLTRSEVDHWAYKHKIPVIFDFDKIPAADLGIVAAYGKIIPKFVILNFKFGILNVHPSLLPKYRGASPVQAAIANGDTTTGVTVIKMDELVDHGPIISSFKNEILPTDTNETLRIRLFETSAKFLIDLIPNYLNGKIKLKPQDDQKATFTKTLKKEDGFVADPSEDPVRSERLFRAMQPWPGIWSEIAISSKKLRLKILKCHLEENKLVFDEVQLEGKNPVSWKQFESAYPDYSFN